MSRHSCIYYLRNLSCSVARPGDGDRAPSCDAAEQALHLTALEERMVTPREYWQADERMADHPVRIGLYRVDAVRPLRRSELTP
jgi:hypothetical protein